MKRESSAERSCPRCRAAMHKVGSVPQLGAHPELVTYRCVGCSHVETVEDRPPWGSA